MSNEEERMDRIRKDDQDWVSEIKMTPDEKFKIIRHAVLNYGTGTIDPLKNAIGVFMIGEHFGWKVLLLMHNQRTIQKYEKILGVKFCDIFPEVGAGARRSIAWNAWCKIQSLEAFWRVVRGEVKSVKSAIIHMIT